jgi:hypothetical protein
VREGEFEDTFRNPSRHFDQQARMQIGRSGEDVVTVCAPGGSNRPPRAMADGATALIKGGMVADVDGIILGQNSAASEAPILRTGQPPGSPALDSIRIRHDSSKTAFL